jgi:hypothetical protein
VRPSSDRRTRNEIYLTPLTGGRAAMPKSTAASINSTAAQPPVLLLNSASHSTASHRENRAAHSLIQIPEGFAKRPMRSLDAVRF